MKHLRKFGTNADLQDWQISKECVKPNVVLFGGTGGVIYNVDPFSGVMIQHIDGLLYTTDEWSANGFANDQANGVAVITPKSKFVIAKTSLGSMEWASDTSNTIAGVTTVYGSTSTARTDYAGAANTALIAAKDTGKAAYTCANFTFPNGTKGYLPALGEWNDAYAYKADVDAAMTLIGGTALGSNIYWSSTQASASAAWRIDWRDGTQGSNQKSNNYAARAFSAL